MSRSAFTIIEVLATLMVLLLGTLAVLALTGYGLRASSRAIGQVSGYDTALTALLDPRAGRRDPFAGDPAWSASGQFSPTYDVTVRGWLNGFYVVRRETSRADDVVDARSRWVLVAADVFWSDNGRPVAALTQRILRRTP